ncbi:MULTISPECIES: hypothetical protein [Flavobacterium]|uniref:Lipoprotein n=1 Tax=Flavobacterium algoritolerans TaxID=3041254 RepID=A0ABT6V999_9FLAO|nr:MULTISPECIES: hypothetical protein [Flavobacterium]MDI5888039.1 hypothetical protein [Flavobacterium yafengii]MDI5894476.1 hypothetical protein [Flavobacterium algoritolerans]
MKKGLLFSVMIIFAFSCAKQMDQKKESKTTILKEEKPELTGGDLDEHGCKASAGYTWSALRKECIRVFEIGTRLNHYEQESATTSAFVIFEANNGNKAELFLDTQKESIILERKSEGQPWVKDDWQLITWKGYVLKKAEEIKYTGQ